jgi:putative endonuclease
LSFERISQKTDLDYTEPHAFKFLMLREEKVESLSAETSNHKIALGRKGELAAAEWLVSKGWRIVATNWRNSKFGEIDIIAEDESTAIVFVEVKTRKLHGLEFGFRNAGFESVNYNKQKKIRSTAFKYLEQENAHRRTIRFDVVVVEYHDYALNETPPSFNHVRQAF